MAYKGKFISNPVTGQSIRFLQTREDTAGELLEMEASFQPNSVEPIPHYHPKQEEFFQVISGAISIRLKGEIKILQSGDTLHIPKNTIHSMWNHIDSEALLNWQVKPALETEFLLETGIGLAQDGKVNKKGMPAFLQSLLIANHFSHVYRPARPPYLLIKIVYVLLAPLAYLLGYRATYQKYQ
jgi:quercetin dioxygenase-like cupin family protein